MPCVLKESVQIDSPILGRMVTIDLFIPVTPVPASAMSLLLINDGQDLEKLGLETLLENLYSENRIRPTICAGIYAGPERKMEYGTAGVPDYAGRGTRAEEYTRFIFEELFPKIYERFGVSTFQEHLFAGFSLGALSAMDIVWSHPERFSTAGIFSGSFWWRTIDQTDPLYDDDSDRIMQRKIRDGAYYPWLRFFFECGGADEGQDRNKNGVIDSIDDTLDLITELVAKGYRRDTDIRYFFIEDGKHNVETWARAMPDFLVWALTPNR